MGKVRGQLVLCVCVGPARPERAADVDALRSPLLVRLDLAPPRGDARRRQRERYDRLPRRRRDLNGERCLCVAVRRVRLSDRWLERAGGRRRRRPVPERLARGAAHLQPVSVRVRGLCALAAAAAVGVERRRAVARPRRDLVLVRVRRGRVRRPDGLRALARGRELGLDERLDFVVPPVRSRQLLWRKRVRLHAVRRGQLDLGAGRHVGVRVLGVRGRLLLQRERESVRELPGQRNLVGRHRRGAARVVLVPRRLHGLGHWRLAVVLLPGRQLGDLDNLLYLPRRHSFGRCGRFVVHAVLGGDICADCGAHIVHKLPGGRQLELAWRC